MITDNRIKYLLEKYIHSSLSPEEYRELLRFFNINDLENNAKQLLYDHFESEERQDFTFDVSIQKVMDNAFIRIENRIAKQKYIGIKRWLPYAAAIVAVLSLCIYWLINSSSIRESQLTTAITTDVSPGSNRATLILGNGRHISLSEDHSEIKISEKGIFYQNGATVVEKSPVQQAKLSTPRKGQYRLILPDGTKVWLNAESEISYPTAFQGKERLVELSGEAYFEVTHDPVHPFIVQSAGQRVKVLGTSFNINAYSNEPNTVTTLASGRIELQDRKKNAKKVLAPGQQAIVGSNLFALQNVDAGLFIAWKDGTFRFKGASLRQVLKQLERWYDVDVDYSHIPDDQKIFASIKRDKKLSSVLDALKEITGIQFRLVGRRLMIMD